MGLIKSKPVCIGLTGGIGSGKSTVADFFKKHNVPVIDADIIAHQITEKNAVAYDSIVSHFGKTILNPDQTINRKQLRDIIFQNLSEKKWLENLLHPMIRKTMRDALQTIQTSYCICVIPLLTESSGIDFIDRVLVIDTPIEIQIDRAKKRDCATEESIQKIIDSQASEQARLKIADDIIINDSDLKSLEEQVDKLHRYYIVGNMG
ncbi:MAG: dephospho-CoA kinase [Gammaproteobacteria bacterium RIFCSPHIGHO2_12_FULL_40_19]|nr:MAG: dephospho-CoA kinase [Gammaproteobacteria bacterium RIFCSPHIGHO2_12_FULL_40_19]